MKARKFTALFLAAAAFVLCFGVNASASKETAVRTPEQLMNMERDGAYYLAGDIDLSGVKWKPISDFSGILDGNGHAVYGLTSETYGLFSTLSSGAEIKNVMLREAYITSKYKTVGGIVSVIPSGADVTIDNCYVSGVVASCRTKFKQNTSSTAGAIVGKNNSSSAVISSCYSNAVVTSERTVGGIAGVNRGTIKSCGFEGQLGSSYNVYELGCDENGLKTELYQYLYCVGGIAGFNYGRITNSYSACTRVEIGTYYGGIVGVLQNGARVSYCVNSSEVPYDDLNTAGGLIAGYASYKSEISNCYTKAPTNVTVENDVGKGREDTVTYGVTEDKYDKISSFKRLDDDWTIWDGAPKLKKLNYYFTMTAPVYEIKSERLVRTRNSDKNYCDDDDLSVDYGCDEFGDILE